MARAEGAGRFGTKAVQARLDKTVELTVELFEGRRRRPLPENAVVRWLQVVPRMEHRHPPGRNNGNRTYANAQFFGPRHGRWIGHDTLEYDTAPLPAGPGVVIQRQKLQLNRAHATRYGGVGTLWIAAEVTLPGERPDNLDDVILRTPDGDDIDAMGVTKQVMRVSFRADDSYLGWLGTFFNVPYVFGSTGPQTDRYTGTDCADVLVGARRASGVRRMRYTSVIGLSSLARLTTPVLLLDGDGRVTDVEGALRPLRWGRDIRPGDLVALDFIGADELPRDWDHVAVLVGDGPAGAPRHGVLDATDLVRHMSLQGLRDEPLGQMGNIRFRVWRWR